MTKTRSKREYVATGAVLVAAAAVGYLLPIDLLGAGLLLALLSVIAVVALVPGVWDTLYRETGVGAGGWVLMIAVAGGGIAMSYLLGDPQPFCDGIAYRGCLTAYGWAAAVFLGSSLGVAITAGHLGRYRRLRAASVAPVAEADGGLLAVEGRIEPAEPTVSGPVSDAQTVWYRCAEEAVTPFNGHREIGSQTGGGEFFVADGSGQLLVLPDGLDDHDVAELARSHTGTDTDSNERRRREWSYQPDDAVTVVGHASEVSRAAYPEPVAVGLDGPVLVGLRSLSELRGWAARRALLGGALTLVVGGTSLLVMLVTA